MGPFQGFQRLWLYTGSRDEAHCGLLRKESYLIVCLFALTHFKGMDMAFIFAYASVLWETHLLQPSLNLGVCSAWGFGPRSISNASVPQVVRAGARALPAFTSHAQLPLHHRPIKKQFEKERKLSVSIWPNWEEETEVQWLPKFIFRVLAWGLVLTWQETQIAEQSWLGSILDPTLSLLQSPLQGGLLQGDKFLLWLV